jgi:hypothetical protein
MTALLSVVRQTYQDGDSELVGAGRRAGVDGASLAAVRIAFGAVAMLSAGRTLANGWVHSLYAGPAERFTYPLLGWVPKPSPGLGYALVLTVLVGGAAVVAGWRWRPALAALWVAFSWIEFVDATTYLNHYWFVSLFGLLLLVAPCAEEFAIGARHRRVAVGWIWLLRAQIAVVYWFAGIAKLNGDWLRDALPLRLWLPARADVPLIGGLLDEPATAYALSWAGAAFDCTIVVLLLWRRTRPLAWLAVVAFHVVTWRLFAIGVFPWLMIAVTTLFFDPAWPRRLIARFTRWTNPQRRRDPVAAPRWSLAAAAVWIVVQLALPVRHHLIPGDARWTGEGYRLSWAVLAVEKGSSVSFRVTDTRTGTTWTTSAEHLYTPLQWKTMAGDPELIRQAAHAVAANAVTAGQPRPEVRVDAFVSLNGRPAQRLIDPDVDLAAEPWRWHQRWILPGPTGTPP